MTRLSCIIPAHNEAARLGGVLAAVSGHPLIDELIVVDDASRDTTAEIAAQAFGVTLIRQERNTGKTRAVARGLAAARGDLILLLDADLVGLAPRHLTELISPVLAGRAATTISLRGNAPAPWRWIGLDYISGERVLPRQILQGLEPPARFGLEVAMNRRLIAEGLPLTVVRWPEVRSPLKSQKMGFWPGVRADARMMRDICRTIPPQEMLWQINAMRRMCV